jgi:hypothetical protein
MTRYEEVENELGAKFILRFNEDNSQSWIPIDQENSDYQAYLNKDKAEQSTPSVIDEA